LLKNVDCFAKKELLLKLNVFFFDQVRVDYLGSGHVSRRSSVDDEIPTKKLVKVEPSFSGSSLDSLFKVEFKIGKNLISFLKFIFKGRLIVK
jgi:hypothetical protein